MNQSIDAGAVPDVSRVLFFDGQRLTAGDLNESADLQRQLRWLHNRSLHSWGIGLGFAVTGSKSDTQVTISPGYAIDCLGREIILTETVPRSVPARAHDGQGNPVIYYLVAAYPDDSRLKVLERRQGECDTEGAVRLEERAALYWKQAGAQSIENGLEIVLAQATVMNCQLAKDLSLEQRRLARPVEQPRVGAGASVRGATGWERWEIGESFVGVQAVVNTSEGRFGVTPHYQAELRGERLVTGDESVHLLDGSVFISGESRVEFTMHVLLAPSSTLGSVPINPPPALEDRDAVLQFIEAEWWVEWVGAEG